MRAVEAHALVAGVLVPLLALAVAGVAGGAIWARWADPPAESELTAGNGELLLGQQFAVDGRYALTGLVLGLVAGVALTLLLRRTGWLLVLGVTIGGVAAAAVSYGFGLFWGPRPEDGLQRGDLLSGGVAVHIPGVFLSWPVGALLGLLLVVWLTDRADDVAAPPVRSDLSPGA